MGFLLMGVVFNNQLNKSIIALTAPAADHVMNPARNTPMPANNAKLPFAVVSATRVEKLLFAFMAVSFHTSNRQDLCWYQP